MIVTLGETMALFRANEIGSLRHSSEFRLSIGGAESNLAIALCRLGSPSTWIGRVGADELGQRILRELKADGVTTLHTIDRRAQTGIMVKSSRTDEATLVSYYRSGSAGSRLCPADVQADVLSRASLLHVTGITPALSDSAADAVDRAMDIATEAGVPISFDVNHRPSLWRERDAPAVYERIARRSNIVFAGEDEARLLAQGSPAELARGICALGASQTIIKRGALGCVAIVDGDEFSQDAIPVRVLDTVGAGDAFVAGYLAELVNGRSVRRRLETAVAMGAFACTNKGDWEGYPNRDELALLGRCEPVTR